MPFLFVQKNSLHDTHTHAKTINLTTNQIIFLPSFHEALFLLTHLSLCLCHLPFTPVYRPSTAHTHARAPPCVYMSLREANTNNRPV